MACDDFLKDIVLLQFRLLLLSFFNWFRAFAWCFRSVLLHLLLKNRGFWLVASEAAELAGRMAKIISFRRTSWKSRLPQSQRRSFLLGTTSCRNQDFPLVLEWIDVSLKEIFFAIGSKRDLFCMFWNYFEEMWLGMVPLSRPQAWCRGFSGWIITTSRDVTENST